MSKVIEINDLNFEDEVLKATTPVLVDYWAQWCGPCLAIAPVLEEIAEDYLDKVKICKINIEANPQTPAKYNVRAIPTLMIFKNGNLEASKVSALSKSQLANFIDTHI